MSDDTSVDVNLSLLRTVLNCKDLPADWHRSYGLSPSRSNALTKRKKDRNSFLNPQSETALTTFLFCNLDRWHQLQAIHPKPRESDAKASWSKTFFEAIRNTGQPVVKPRLDSDLWDALLKSAFPNECLPSMSSAVLLLEFEILNWAFHPDRADPKKAFRQLSFLPINKQEEWSQFDAVLIVPQGKKGTFYFVEAKLHSDVSTGTTKYPYVSQLIRNLESAFHLTRHESSQYQGWDFRYIFVCPKKALRYKATYYAYALGEHGKAVRDTISNYAVLLDDEAHDWKDNKAKRDVFEAFREETPNRVAVVPWCELAAIAEGQSPGGFAAYRSLLKECIDLNESEKSRIDERFSAVGIVL